MIGTYEEYLKEPKSLTVEEMQALHRALLEELGDDEDAWDLYRDPQFQYAGTVSFRDRTRRGVAGNPGV